MMHAVSVTFGLFTQRVPPAADCRAEVRGAREREEVALSALRPSVWVVLGVWHLRGESGRRHRELRGGGGTKYERTRFSGFSRSNNYRAQIKLPILYEKLKIPIRSSSTQEADIVPPSLVLSAQL